MSDTNHAKTRNQSNCQQRTTFNVPDSSITINRYVQNQHLSTPPAIYRSRNVSLGDGRQFVNVSHGAGYYPSNLQLPQINTIYSPYAGQPQSQSYARSSESPSLQQNKVYNSRIQTPTINPGYNKEQIPISQSQILSFYEGKKNEYINRINKLEDHVQLNFPDGGKYIGQILHDDRNKINKNLSCVKHGQGIFLYPNGDTYFGSWNQDLFDGQGIYIFTTGEIYDGLLRKSQKQGRGTYYYQNGTAFYSGTWQNDLKHGIGVLNSQQQYYEGHWKNGVKHGSGYEKHNLDHFVYIGNFNNGIKEGEGRIAYNDGSVYAGLFRNGIPHGIGDMEYPNKDKYIGEFLQGKKHGKGNYFFSQGTVFSGFWQNDQKIQGELTLFNGDVFNGIFRNNQRYQGKYRYRNGDLYEGTWKNDVKDGFGKLYLQNGQRYEGQFVEGQKHGEGVYMWKNGDRYQGHFSHDNREGLGEYYWNDGGFYKGEWNADRMNGFGRLVKDGVDVIGEFFADRFQRPIQQYELGAMKNFVKN